ncbi:ketosteroid isomerase-related protein [Tateyamaria sp. syn59]|uniref:ketosteroid isomerase-related protein n=1 Tax=Tateyamaria sp. syn59 TaxID=2576942 RepID=UPI00351AA4E5
MDVVHRYLEAFNAGDIDRMLDCLTEDIAHHVNEGQVRTGKALFRDFCQHMSRCYAETLTDMVVFATPDGTRAAAEYTVNGTYLQTDAGLPEAHGQTYCLPAGSFFDIRDRRIARVTTYYNLADWIRQVRA